jgi:TonB family protein
MRFHLPFVVILATAALAQGRATPPRLAAAEVGGTPWNAVSGGIAAYDVAVDEQGGVGSKEIVQDVPPYGTLLGDALGSWRFEPATDAEGRPVKSRVLVLGFFRPPAVTFAAPQNPKYKRTVAPEEIPWPTSVAVPAYPLNAVGSGKVILEADVSDEGKVASARILTSPTPFDEASLTAIRAWKFRPARVGGREAPSRVFLVFSFPGTTP